MRRHPRLTTPTLLKIHRTAEDGNSAFSRQDAMRKAANARASIVGYGDDVRVFIEAVKESMNTVAGRRETRFRILGPPTRRRRETSSRPHSISYIATRRRAWN